MKAILFQDSLEIREIDLPQLSPGYFRIKVLYSGLCGSDINKIASRASSEISILGHEFVGQIVESYDESLDRIGDIVACNPLLPCRSCPACLSGNDNLCQEFRAIGRTCNGAFSEYVDVPVQNTYLIPGVSPRLAVLNDVVAVCLHAIEEFTENVHNKKCLIIGNGPIGIMLCCLLHIFGARAITLRGKHRNTFDYMQKIIPELEFLDFAEEANDCFDLVFESVGRNQSDTIKTAIKSLNTRGMLIVMGVFSENEGNLFFNKSFCLKEASLRASVAYKEKYFQKGLEILSQNPWLEAIITHEFSLKQFQDAMTMLKTAKDTTPVIKVTFHNTL